jgi:AP-2 complex subunit beta-1
VEEGRHFIVRSVSYLEFSFIQVQLALLTATVKLFLKRPTVGGELVPKVLKWATEDVDNPDCRDRGFMYWRLLSTDPATAKKIVLADKPPISTETDRMDRQLLDQLLLHGASLSSIFHRQPQTFIRGAKARYMPDSPALDETARRHASTHIYSKPVAKGPYLTNSNSSTQAPAHVNGKGDGHSNGKSNDMEKEPVYGRTSPSTEPTQQQAKGEEQEERDEEQREEGGEQEPDPYSMLGDDFGGEANAGYTADAPMPKAGAIDDLLL